MIADQVLLGLAPSDLPIRRLLRFDGAGLEVPLTRFAPADRLLIRRIYQEVDGLSRLWKSMGAAPDWSAIGQRAAASANQALVDEALKLGQATRTAGLEDSEIRKALHDIRGGGLTVLIGAAGMLAGGFGMEGLPLTCAAAARDHAKIMRCLVPDLDPEGRSVDEEAKSHAIGHFVDKWQEADLRGPNGRVRVAVRCEFQGAIAARCLETASIDRIVYNLMNNAARFATDGRADLIVTPVSGDLIRWVVGNRVTADESAFLNGIAISSLFAGGVTRGGNGVGLANCAAVVADCFGFTSPTAAVAGGYLGAAIRGNTFLSWFHWPKYVTPS